MESGDYPNYIGIIVYVVLLVIYGILNAFFSAIDNANETLIEEEAEDGNKKAKKLLYYFDNPSDFSDSIHLFNGLTYLICGMVCVPSFTSFVTELNAARLNDIHTQNILVIIVGAVCFVLLLSTGYAAMKIGGVKEEKAAYKICGIASCILNIVIPLRVSLRLIAACFVRLFGVDPNKNLDEVSEDEIISMVNEGHEQGLLESSEAEMIHNIFEFMDKDAQDIMTHRKNMITLSGESTFVETLDFMLESNYSRFPVYMEDTDNIIGVVHIRDCMEHMKDKGILEHKLCEVDGLIREVSFIPETRKISDLFKSMQEEKNHLAIVVDEYGQTSGLVTMEDILEEIVGNIFDEYDEEEQSFTTLEDGTYIINGMTPLDEVSEFLDIDLPVDDYDTLNGYLISLIDRIPTEDEKIQITAEGFLYEVMSVENKMIQTVHVIRNQVEDTEERKDNKE